MARARRDGVTHARLQAVRVATAGIGRKFQKPTVYERLAVLDNLAMSLAGPRSVRASLFARPDGAESARGCTDC